MQFAEIQERCDALRHLHIDSDRERIRAVMNGGAEGIQAVLTWGSSNPAAEAAAIGIDLPTANVMWSGLERLAQRIGRIPTLKVDLIPIRDTKTARDSADKRARIVDGWDEMDRLEMQFPQIGRWLPGYGFTMHRIKERQVGDTTYPVAELADPYDVYPGWWGPGQQPVEACVVRRIPLNNLRAIYPGVEIKVKMKHVGGGVVLREDGWEGRGNGVEVIEYIDEAGTWVICTEAEALLSFIPNPLQSGPAFVFTKRFSFDKLKSQYTHVFGLMAMMAKMNLLGLIGSEDSTFRETNIFGDLLSERYSKGRDAINFLEPGTRVEKPTGDIVNQTWQAINILERQFRIVAGYDVQQDGISPNSFATGAGMEQLQGSPDNNVKEYLTAIKHSTELIDRKRLEWEERMHPNAKKRVRWYEGSEAFEEIYVPKEDIAGDYRTRRVYGAMATFDETQKLLAGMQLLGARVIDRETLQENLDGLDNIGLVNERIDRDTAKEQLMAGLGQRFGAGDPTSGMALVGIMQKPGETNDVLAKLFTPEEPQMSPEEEAMAAGGMPGAGGAGMAGMLPGGGQGEAGPGASPESVQTVLSLMEGQGGGVQTVQRT